MPRLSSNLNRLSVDSVDRSRSVDSSARGFFLCLAALVLSVHFGAVQIAKAQPGSRARLAAEKLFAEGEGLRKQASSQGYEAAIKKYEAALPLWQAASDPRSEARTLKLIGELHNFLGNNQQHRCYGFADCRYQRQLDGSAYPCWSKCCAGSKWSSSLGIFRCSIQRQQS